jgi:hypothetical protein
LFERYQILFSKPQGVVEKILGERILTTREGQLPDGYRVCAGLFKDQFGVIVILLGAAVKA